MNIQPPKGRSTRINTENPYHALHFDPDISDDNEFMFEHPKTQLFYETPKTILSQNHSPDVPANYSLNPYQGCEHGCMYCYARPSHEYWGFSAGIDFETKIVVKKNAPQLLEQIFLKKTWKPTPVMLSGNTDCYQPLENRLQITRNLLKVFQRYGNPVGIITKNSLVLRDLDILKDLATEQLVHVMISINSLDETLRRVLEPRTSSVLKRFKSIERLTSAGIPTGVMISPVIPGLNDQDVPEIIRRASESGAMTAGYTLVRLNGHLTPLFEDWLMNHFPDKKKKVMNHIREVHGGTSEDKRFGKRMRGEGVMAETIAKLFKMSRKKWMNDQKMPHYNLNVFRRKGVLNLFD